MHNSSKHDAPLLRVLVLTTLVQVIATAVALALAPIAPRAALGFGIDAHYVGYQISLIYMAGALGSALAGTLLQRHGAYVIEIVTLLLFAAGLVLLATSTLWIGIVASLLIGLGYGLQNPASSQILNAACPPAKRSVVFSIKQAGVPLGAVLASLSLPALDAAFGWQRTLAVAAIVPAALALKLWVDHRDAPHAPAARRSFRANFLAEQRLVWKSRPLLVLSLVGMVYSAAQLSLSAFIVLMLVEDQGWKLATAAAVGGALQASGAAGRVSWGWLADRAGSGFAILALIGLLSTTGLCALPFLMRLPVFLQVGLLVALGFSLSGWNGVAMSEIARFSPPGMTGQVMGGALVYTFLGVMMGPSSYALLYEVTARYDMTFACIAALTAAGGLASMAMALQRRTIAKG
ncbi:MFS transporter [Novosphingobium olei]|uniref:MFS transporter n=1 Tax=Novosphingobium olei TaxID=2728851 RepID=A0A7Y0BMF3_9SPHN|nr:MFS transporter [Novosphingobium olei]NML92890.1 MFS transporter [Novosphingobium olei]